MRTRASCQEAQDAVAGPLSDAFAQARVAAHRSRCADCRAYADHIAATACAVRLAAGPGLDDIARARVTARLALALDDLATHNSLRQRRTGQPTWRRTAAAASLAAVAAAGLLFVYRHHGQPQPLIPKEPATAALPAAVPVPIVEKLAPPPPPAVPSTDFGFAARLVKGRLAVPAGTTVRASVDRYTRLTIVGPAQLSVESVAPQISLRLQSGLLLGEYEHHRGGTLRVNSPGATTVIVGTIFAVQATDDAASRVAVRRGVVQVQSRTETIHLHAGWSWASGEAARPEIPAALNEQLAAHEAARPESALKPAPFTSRVRPAGAQQAMVSAIASSPEPAATAAATPSATAADRDPATTKEAQTAAAKPLAAAPDTPPAATADSLYKEAEAAMRTGDRAAVRTYLTEVIRRFPRDGLADAALYELARREQAEGQPAQARWYLDKLLSHDGEKELREPARYLRCRLELDAHHDAEAIKCLGAFRSDFPVSLHDAEVLALLIGLYQTRSDCPRALPLLDEYSRRYPRGPLDTEARRRRCGH